MSSDSIQKIARLRQFLISEGWVVSDVIRADQGLELFSHANHERRQLSLPIDDLYADWEEACDRVVEKVAEMTGRKYDDLARLVFAPAGPTSGFRKISRKRFAGVLAVASAAFCAGLWIGQSTLGATPVSISLAGCMDRNAARSVGMMAYDAYAKFSEPSAGVNNFLWTRQRALQAATFAEEMRRCYLEAQLASEGFDGNGLIAEDMDRIDASIRSVYSDIGASLIPGAERSIGTSSAVTVASFRSAQNAATRISMRLGTIVRKAYF